MPTTTAAPPPLPRLALQPAPALPAPEPCPNCGAPVAAAFCGECGERSREADALSLRHLATEAFEHTTSLDLKLLHTLVTLVRRPGEVTRAYVAGARRRYTPPLQLFLLINVAFFLAAPRVGIFRYGLDGRAAAAVVARAAAERDGGGRAAPLRVPVPEARTLVAVARRTGWSAAELQARFNAAVEERTRTMASLWIVMLALLLLVVYAGRGRYLAEHVVFATHYFTFALVYVPAVLLPEQLATTWLTRHGARVGGRSMGLVTAVSLLGGLAAYLVLALRRVYGDRWPLAVVRAAIVLAALALGGGLAFYVAVTAVTARLL